MVDSIARLRELDLVYRGERFEHVHRVTAAEDDHGLAGQRESQVGDLVLDHVGPLGFWRCRGELAGADGKLGETGEARQAEPHIARLAAEPGPRTEVR